MNYYPLYTDPLWVCLWAWLMVIFVGGIMGQFMNNHRR